MPGPITEFTGTPPALNQTQPEFDQNTQDLIDWMVGVPNEINAFSEDLNNIPTSATSVTSNNIGTGSKAFTIQTGKGLFPGQSLTIARTSAPANRMFAVVDTYDSATGALVVTSQAVEGSGTGVTDWTITLGFNGVISSGQMSTDTIHGQTQLTAPDVADEILVFDASANGGAGALRRINLQDALEVINALTEDTSPDRALDFILSYDASANTVKKLALNNLGVNLGQVRLNTANGYGSTNTQIRRFTNIDENVGSDITYADSATNGASFTINASGVYAISYTDQYSGQGSVGISKNSNQLTTSINTITASHRIGFVTTSQANLVNGFTWVGKLTAGDVIRPHDSGVTTGTTTTGCQFTIVRIA
jgi:hypothetical protein